MASFQWTEQYETGVPIIDRQHRELFKRIDHLMLALYDGEGIEGLKEIIEFLESYTIEHFHTEEELMVKNKFPDFAKHQEKHQGFRELFNDVKREFDEKGGDSYLAIRLEKEVRNWWENHILQTDMQYVPYIKER
jgi:hemerythrin